MIWFYCLLGILLELRFFTNDLKIQKGSVHLHNDSCCLCLLSSKNAGVCLTVETFDEVSRNLRMSRCVNGRSLSGFSNR